MPLAQRDGVPDDDGLTARRPSKDLWAQRSRVLEGMFPSIQTITELLEEEMQVPSGRLPGFGRDDTAERYWRRVLRAADDGDLVEGFYQLPSRAVQRRKLFNERFEDKGLLADNRAPVFAAKFYDELARMPVLHAAAARRADVHGSALVFPPNGQGGW